MSTVVIMPGGFHPFHAGHMALYNSAREAFPGAEVYVAASNDTKTRPFPFELKEKLAKVAGVQPGHFVQVKSPFQPKEITQNYDPEKDVVIFVRSQKDMKESPIPGGVKKNGEPAYFQPFKRGELEPFGKHAYMAYLPTVEFGPGITSATEIRNAWPKLDDRRKTAMVMSLYPATQKNPKLAANVVQMLDIGMGSEQINEFAPVGGDGREPDEEEILRQLAAQWYHGDEDPKAERTLEMMGWEIGHVESGDDDAGVFVVRAGDENGDSYIAFNQSDLNLNEGEVVSMQTRKTPLVLAGNPFDWDIYDLRTGKVVANLLGGDRHDSPLYEIRINKNGLAKDSKMKPTYVATGNVNDDGPHGIYELEVPSKVDKIEKSLGPGGTTKLRPDNMDMLGHMAKQTGQGKYYGYDLVHVADVDAYTWIEKVLGAKIMDVDDAMEAGYTDVDPEDSAGIIYTADQQNEGLRNRSRKPANDITESVDYLEEK